MPSLRLLSRAMLLATLAATALPSPAGGAPTDACHCFRDRAFDPSRPAAADPYILATARSSLLSAAFGADKRWLVQKVMTGTTPEDLWIAHWAGARLGLAAAALLEGKAAGGSWKAALADIGRDRLASAFERHLAGGAPDGELAAIAVDDVLANRLEADRSALDALRATGATTPETILAILLAPRLSRSPPEVLASVKQARTTWGALLGDAGVAPPELGALIRQRLR